MNGEGGQAHRQGVPERHQRQRDQVGVLLEVEPYHMNGEGGQAHRQRVPE